MKLSAKLTKIEPNGYSICNLGWIENYCMIVELNGIFGYELLKCVWNCGRNTFGHCLLLNRLPFKY